MMYPAPSSRFGVFIHELVPIYLKLYYVKLYGIKITDSNYTDFIHTRNNNIMFNDISDVMRDSQDGGGIDTWSTGKNNIIDNNRIHDIDVPLGFGHGISIDDCSIDFTIKNNILYNFS